MTLSRNQQNHIVPLNFTLNGVAVQRLMLLGEVACQYTESFQRWLLEAMEDGDEETVPYDSPYANQPISGSITGHVDDDDQFEIEAENELDEIWNGGGSMKFTEEDWGY